MQPEAISSHPTSCFSGPEFNYLLSGVCTEQTERNVSGFQTVNGSGRVMGCWCHYLPEKSSGFLFLSWSLDRNWNIAQGNVAITISVVVQKAHGCDTWGYGLVVDTVVLD